jgi:hypothetical protein
MGERGTQEEGKLSAAVVRAIDGTWNALTGFMEKIGPRGRMVLFAALYGLMFVFFLNAVTLIEATLFFVMMTLGAACVWNEIRTVWNERRTK